VKLPPKSPHWNAYAEWFVHSIKETWVQEFLAHYHGERNHPGLENRLIQAEECPSRYDRAIPQRQRLGG
jgi:hypothetical protein